MRCVPGLYPSGGEEMIGSAMICTCDTIHRAYDSWILVRAVRVPYGCRTGVVRVLQFHTLNSKP